MLHHSNHKHNHLDAINLQDAQISPGQNVVVQLKAGQLPSGSVMTSIAHVFRSKNPGPIVLLLGGIHGDELNGIQIVTSLLEAQTFTRLESGSIIAIPLLNVYGFNNLQRDLPDGKDVNRCFPGSTGGSLASRLARTITKHVLPFADFAIDYHTGGADRYNYPQTRYSKADPISRKMAEIFSAPFSIQNSMISGSFRKAATDMGCHALVYEGGESVRINKTAIDHGVNGTIRLLKALNLLSQNITVPNTQTVFIEKTDWIRASQAGIFSWLKKSGDIIKTGDTLGVIKDPYGLKSYEVISKFSGSIIGHNNAAVVNLGDALFHIGL
jgi:hypothetical protein